MTRKALAPAAAAALAAAVVLAACSTSAPPASRPGTGRPTSTHTGGQLPPPATATRLPNGGLHPSVPASARTGENACGDPYAINATDKAGTIPLLDCPGFAGLTPTPTLTVPVGGNVRISGLTAGETLTTRSDAVTTLGRGLYRATRPGRAVITIFGHQCVPTPGGGPQSTGCPLLAITVH